MKAESPMFIAMWITSLIVIWLWVAGKIWPTLPTKIENNEILMVSWDWVQVWDRDRIYGKPMCSQTFTSHK